MMLTDAEIHNIDQCPHSMFDKQRLDFARAVIAANNAKVLANLSPDETMHNEWWYSEEKVSALIQDRDLLAARVKELEIAAANYMQCVDTMNAAMKDGCNVHGAISSLVGATDNLESLLGQNHDNKTT